MIATMNDEKTHNPIVVNAKIVAALHNARVAMAEIFNTDRPDIAVDVKHAVEIAFTALMVGERC